MKHHKRIEYTLENAARIVLTVVAPLFDLIEQLFAVKMLQD